MTKIQRIGNILSGLLMILAAGLFIRDPDSGFRIILLILTVSLTVSGIRYLVYYFTMARHMAGGQSMLWKGIILLEIGIYVGTLHDLSPVYIMLYLIVGYVFDGAIDILRSLEERKIPGTHWKLKLATGIGEILIAVLCVLYINSPLISVYIFCFGILSGGIMKIVSAFRRNAIVYIQ